MVSVCNIICPLTCNATVASRVCGLIWCVVFGDIEVSVGVDTALVPFVSVSTAHEATVLCWCLLLPKMF